MNKKNLLVLSVVLIALAGALSFAAVEGWIGFPPLALTVFRWLALSTLIYYAIVRKSLTTTILISMVIGVEVGLDFPEFSQNLKVLSQIFLRLIKTIIAPLLFATLVYGIAGHSNLKQVGRMGWKSILYFEVVTTIALFIG
ncbi:MAG: cation:dicarboxylase symporter family transporter, partial [Bacteroidia bacterium]